MGRPKKVPPVVESPALPNIEILERRLAHPLGTPSVPITLKTEGGPWAVRIINAGVRSGRVHSVIHNLGWVYVSPQELDGSPNEYGFKALDGRIVRGEHGEEVLVKMPLAMFEQIQRAKADQNLRGLGKKQTMETVAQATAQQFGSEAGDKVHASMQLDVVDSRERVELEPQPS